MTNTLFKLWKKVFWTILRTWWGSFWRKRNTTSGHSFANVIHKTVEQRTFTVIRRMGFHFFPCPLPQYYFILDTFLPLFSLNNIKLLFFPPRLFFSQPDIHLRIQSRWILFFCHLHARVKFSDTEIFTILFEAYLAFLSCEHSFSKWRHISANFH